MDLEDLKQRYIGKRAENYDRDRESSAEWQREQKVVDQMLIDAGLGPDHTVLDIPVGTGRFLDFYRKAGCRTVGIDVSPDMLKYAAERAAQADAEAEFREGDITRIDMADASAHTVVCVRIMNLVEFPVFRNAMAEAARVSSAYVIAGVQIRIPTSIREVGWKAALRNRLNRSRSRDERTTTPHPERAVLRTFDKCGLSIVRRELIVKSKQTPYYMYLLRKN
jgi:ubiquinone/menaquinone biosynthesis C-methylase UbiE